MEEGCKDERVLKEHVVASFAEFHEALKAIEKELKKQLKYGQTLPLYGQMLYRGRRRLRGA